jgi:hypothetical protein
MRMKKKKKSFPKKPALVLTAAALLLVGSTVGSTRAALTYYSENYSAQMNMQSIGVSLLENDKVVSSRDYVSNNEREPQKASFSQIFSERMIHLHRAKNITKQSASRTAVRSTPLYVSSLQRAGRTKKERRIPLFHRI